ncbi:methylamine utilization protein [Alteromonadaceae bacterium BrNp21-10]|nr:methylamine utilization protein [Alteromonadaceae bacterium BrNp21-10]
MNSLRKIVVNLVVSGVFFLHSANVLAMTTLQIVDQHGKPLPQAVVEVDGQTKASTANLQEIAIMDQVDKQFSPRVLVIQQGQSVLFPNSDNTRHHVYSFSAVKPFEIKLYSGKRKDPILFDHHGVAVLGCNIHDSMVGYIYIAQSDVTAISDEQGMVHFPQQLTKKSQVSVWHSLAESGAESRLTVKLDELTFDGNQYVINLQVHEPQKRNTFGDKFGQ